VARSLARIRGDRGQLFFPSSCFTSSITPLFMDPSLVISQANFNILSSWFFSLLSTVVIHIIITQHT
jgi:hypothetical protein